MLDSNTVNISYNKTMKINGQQIADTMYDQLKDRVGELQKKNIIPHLVTILVGNRPESEAYIKLKNKKGEQLGARVTILRYPTTITQEELEKKIKLLNIDPYVHGILIQRPLPEHIDEKALEMLTNPEKDIDGFHPDSPYTLPLPLAVEKILQEVFLLKNRLKSGVARIGTPLDRPHRAERTRTSEWGVSRQNLVGFKTWLDEQAIVLIGKGTTGGGPIHDYFNKQAIKHTVIDSSTKNADELMQQADIIISAVGKKYVVQSHNIKPNAILISVGLFRDEKNKLSGDYDVELIKDVASFYTATPGGVGPVNVAKLMENLVTATEKQTR